MAQVPTQFGDQQFRSIDQGSLVFLINITGVRISDEETGNHIYRDSAQFESGTTEVPIVFPASIAELVQVNRQLLENKVVPDLSFSSAVRHGLFGLVLMACRHFRTPFPPQFWMPFLLRNRGEGDKVESHDVHPLTGKGEDSAIAGTTVLADEATASLEPNS